VSIDRATPRDLVPTGCTSVPRRAEATAPERVVEVRIPDRLRIPRRDPFSVQAQIVLTLSIGSLRNLIAASDPRCPNLRAIPGFASRTFGSRGLNVPASMLAGLAAGEFERLRDGADRAGCPYVVLVEDRPLPFGDPDPDRSAAAEERLARLAAAADRLGCRDVAIRCESPDTDDALERTAAALKSCMGEVDRHDLNVLLAPHEGLTDDPDRLAALIKRVGGFRIGSLPSFGHAHARGDAEKTLRKLAPYADSIDATVVGFDAAGSHQPFDLAACLAAVRGVGYVNTLALDFVGPGDPIAALERARAILEPLIGSPES